MLPLPAFGRALALALALTPLLVGFWVPGCTGGAPGDGDASGHRDAGPDGWVDLGPIDCEGEPPHEDAACIQGQVYDFGTEQPINVPGDVQVVAINAAWFHDESYFPDLKPARVRSDGKVATWQGISTTGYSANILYLLDGVPGYLDAAVNVYRHLGYMSQFDWWRARLYLVSEELLSHWSSTYQGSVDLATFRPITLGRVFFKNYEPDERTYEWSWSPGGGPLYFEQEGIFFEATTFSEDRLSFGEDYKAWHGPIPPGGALMLLVDSEDIDVGPRLGPNDPYLEPTAFLAPLETSFVDSGAISYLILHYPY